MVSHMEDSFFMACGLAREGTRVPIFEIFVQSGLQLGKTEGVQHGEAGGALTASCICLHHSRRPLV
jgi:hypothetical protein